MAKAAQYRHWQVETDAQALTWATLDVVGERVNVLSGEVIDELSSIVAAVIEDRPRALIFASGKPSGFLAGADVKEFRHMTAEVEAAQRLEEVHALFDRIEALPLPSVAMLQGLCLGGGLELALACRYRIAEDAPATRIGFPEIQLGIHPGYGGTMRSIRAAGALAALNLMLTGRYVDARKAKRLGLVHAVVPARHLRQAARQFATEHLSNRMLRHPRPRGPGLRARLAGTPLGRIVLAPILRRQVAKRADPAHYPAPYALIDLWRSHGGNPQAMLREERASALRLIQTDTARNLLRLFFLQERLKSQARGEHKARRVHVIGAGTMGGDIAAWCAYKDCFVTLQDREPRFIAPAMERAHALFGKRIRDRRARTAVLDRLVPDIAGHGVARADLVIEAIVEDLEIKRKLFADLEPRLQPDAILATNTSSIPLEQLAQPLDDPSRLVGIHFFNPVARMQIVEIIGTPQTSDAARRGAAEFVAAVDRLPIFVKSSAGFLINRILTPYMFEAVEMIEDGIQAEKIDQAIRTFGMPMGPVELADVVGLDICLAVAKVLAEHFGIEVPAMLSRKVSEGRLGRKTGRGFYEYRKGKKLAAKVHAGARDAADITDRLILRIVNEAVACLREGVVEDADLVDAAMVFGTGFAPFRGGPMQYLRARGPAEVKQKLEELARRFGERFKPDAGWDEVVGG